MNFLAHAYLSPPAAVAPGILVGNMTADFVKGPARLELPPALQAGMRLHTRIDRFADTHPAVLRAADLLEDRWGRYASVLVDVFWDYFLAADWPRFHPQPLAEYVAELHRVLLAYVPLLPTDAQHLVQAMVSDNWIGRYGQLSGIELALLRLSRRLRHGIDLAEAVDDLRAHQPAFQAAFDTFFPQLVQHATEAGTMLEAV